MEAVLKKLRLPDGGIILNAPAEIEQQLLLSGFNNKLKAKGENENILVFVNDSRAALTFLDKQLKLVKRDGMLWLAYPKGTSGIATDINRDKLWQLAAPFGIRPVAIVAFNAQWSALRFRPLNKAE
jgi:hypothetical protein